MKWSFQVVDIGELQKNEKNPRRISKDQANRLRTSLEKFGACQPIVINKDKTIIGGHQRYEIFKRLGYKSVEVYVPETDLSEEEEKELMVLLNKISGDWDSDILANNWSVESLLEYGFLPKEIGIDLEDIKLDVTKKLSVTFQSSDNDVISSIRDLITRMMNEYLGLATYKFREK